MISRQKFLLGAAAAALLPTIANALAAPLFFVDTDLDSDIDDVTMIALLLGMLDEGQLIGATVASNAPTAAPCMRVLLDYAGQTSVPVGAYMGTSIGGGTKSLYTKIIRDEFRPGDTRANYPDAVTVMHKALADAPDGSVTLITGGTLTNVSALLAAHRDLVEAKCSKIVAMGGHFTSASTKEHNILFDVAAANDVATKSPVPVYWAGGEVGGSIFTQIPVSESPYSRAWDLGASLHKNGRRQSWDLMAVLFAVQGEAGLFAVNGPREVAFNEQGNTSHRANAHGRNYYLSKVASDDTIAAACQAILDRQPLSAVAYTK